MILKNNREATSITPKNTQDATRKELLPRDAIRMQPYKNNEFGSLPVNIDEWPMHVGSR